MTTAADIITALDGDHSTGMCRCPLHDDGTPSLSVQTGDRVPIVLKCFAGCSQEALVAWAKDRNLWPASSRQELIRNRIHRNDRQEEQKESERFFRAVRVLRAAAASAAKPIEYLMRRAVTIVPRNARLLPADLAGTLTSKRCPAMVFPITSADGLQGAHITWLSRDATSKLAVDRPRRMYGRAKGGYVRLGRPPRRDKRVVIGEGIETTLSAMQVSGIRSGLAALSAQNMAFLSLARCRGVIIAADNDQPGRKYAAQLAERLEFEGHNVTIVLPPKKGTDWNDVLQRHGQVKARSIWRRMLMQEMERDQADLSHSVEDFMELVFPKREMLMAPWLPQPGIAMLFARAGHAKTYTALGIAYAVARGEAFLGWQCERPGRVLYIDGEMPGAYLQQRLALYGRAPKGALHVVCRDTFNLRREMMPDLGTPEGRQVIDDIIKGVRPDLVILDSLSTLVRSGEENSAEDWRPVQDWLMGHRWRGRSMLMVHHAGKSGDYRGTSKRIDTPETIIKLTKKSDVQKADDESAFELEFVKGRELWGADEESMMVYFAVRDRRITWRHEQVRDVKREQIREMFGAGMKHGEIAKEVGLSRVRVTQIIGELKQSATVVPFPRGGRK